MVRTSGEWDYYAHRRHINQPGNQAESRLLAGCKGGVQMISMQIKCTLREMVGEAQGGMTIWETVDCQKGCVTLVYLLQD